MRRVPRVNGNSRDRAAAGVKCAPRSAGDGRCRDRAAVKILEKEMTGTL